MAKRIQAARIKIGARRHTRVIDRGSAAPVVLGCDRQCDLRVEGRHVCGIHACVEERADGFYLLDHSAKGTFVLPDGARMYVIAPGENTKLNGAGLISLGDPVDLTNPYLIRYQCE